MPRIGPVWADAGEEFYRPERASLKAALMQISDIISHPHLAQHLHNDLLDEPLAQQNFDTRGPILPLRVPIQGVMVATKTNSKGDDQSLTTSYNLSWANHTNNDPVKSRTNFNTGTTKELRYATQAFMFGFATHTVPETGVDESTYCMAACAGSPTASAEWGDTIAEVFNYTSDVYGMKHYEDYKTRRRFENPVFRLRRAVITTSSPVFMEIFTGGDLLSASDRRPPTSSSGRMATTAEYRFTPSKLWARSLKDALAYSDKVRIRMTVPPSQQQPVGDGSSATVSTSILVTIALEFDQTFSVERDLTYLPYQFGDEPQDRVKLSKILSGRIDTPSSDEHDWTEGIRSPSDYGQYCDRTTWDRDKGNFKAARCLFVPMPNVNSVCWFPDWWCFYKSGRFPKGTEIGPDMVEYLRDHGGLLLRRTDPMPQLCRTKPCVEIDWKEFCWLYGWDDLALPDYNTRHSEERMSLAVRRGQPPQGQGQSAAASPVREELAGEGEEVDE